MYEKFLKLKEEKAWLFWLLIIPFIFVAGLEFYNKYLVNSGKQAVKDAEKADKDLKKEQTKAELGGEYHEEKAEEIEEKINDIKTDKDWHLK
jgi:hypothetical protein